jgi:DNA polymerase-3 subunit alpha
MLERTARHGLDERLNTLRTLDWSPEREKPCEERLAFELGIIRSMGFAGYFLIVADFINWAKNQGIPSGRAAAPPPGASSPGRSASPISTRSRTASSSSAS